MDLGQLIQTITIYAIPVLLSITLHEAAHGYAARHFGDNTAYMEGRITLNPLKHIDPMGTILMPLILYIATSGAFLFGYAKPVPVRFGNLRRPKQDMVWVALAGPGSNFVQALFWGALLYLMQGAGVSEPFFVEMAQGGILVNVVMFVFNLFRSRRWTAAAFWWACCRTVRRCWCHVSSPTAFSSSWRWCSAVWSATCGCAR